MCDMSVVLISNYICFMYAQILVKEVAIFFSCNELFACGIFCYPIIESMFSAREKFFEHLEMTERRSPVQVTILSILTIAAEIQINSILPAVVNVKYTTEWWNWYSHIEWIKDR